MNKDTSPHTRPQTALLQGMHSFFRRLFVRPWEHILPRVPLQAVPYLNLHNGESTGTKLLPWGCDLEALHVNACRH